MAEINRQKRFAIFVASLVLILLVSSFLASALYSGEAYADKGKDLVSFTVYHQDEEGNTLADTQVFFGHPGEKPVVSSKEIDGYVPEEKELTKTLSEDEAENVFTFVYQIESKKALGGGNTVVTVIFALICLQILILFLIWRHIKKKR